MSIFLQHVAHTWNDAPENDHCSLSDEHCNNQRVATRLAKENAVEADHEPGSPYKKGSHARLKLKSWMARIKHKKSKGETKT